MTPQRRQLLLAGAREFRRRASVAAVKRENGPRAEAFSNLLGAIDNVLSALETPDAQMRAH